MRRPLESYRILNRVVLGIVIACLALPIPLTYLSRVAPGWMPVCASRLFFGKPCPLCGMTRALATLMTGDIHEAQSLNALALPFFFLLLLELAWRVHLSFLPIPADRYPRLARIDLYVHLAAIAAYLLYSFRFLLRTWL